MEDGRYIIMPAGMRDDGRLQLSHMRVALVLGSYSKRRGWTDLSQQDIGEIAGVSRQTVNQAVTDLVDWGWVKRIKKQKKNQYIYRFIMDQDDYCQVETTVPKDCKPQATVHCQVDATSTVASDPTINKENSSSYRDQVSSAGARASDASASRAPRARAALTVSRNDVQWRAWLDAVDIDTAERIERAGEFTATARWPTEGERIISIANARVDITARMTGERVE